MDHCIHYRGCKYIIARSIYSSEAPRKAAHIAVMAWIVRMFDADKAEAALP
jgi:hypothetical protein